MSSSLSDHSPAPKRIEFDDPHAGIGNLQEAEVSRVRILRGGWRWALVIATAATILLCINQQFSLRFFIDYTQLNTEYFYLLIALMLPFTFLIFPGTETAPLDRIPWYDIILFALTFGASIWLMLNIRKAALSGWESDGAPKNVIAAGLVMWFVLMEALRRTGGWSLLLSVLPFTVYPLFAEASWLGPFRGSQLTLEQATSYHVLSGESLLGIPIQAFADTVIGFLVFGTALMMTGAGKFFINIAFALCGTFRGGAAKVCIFASGLLGMMSGSIISNVLTAGTMTIPVMKKSGFRASYAGAIEACASTGAVLAPAGDGRDRIRDRAVPECQLRRCRDRGDHSRRAVLCRPVHASGLLRRPARSQGHPARRIAEDHGYHQGRLVLRLRHRLADRHAAVFQAREPRAVLCNRAASGSEPAVLQGDALDADDYQQVPGSQRPHLCRTDRHSRGLRAPDRRVLDDRRGLQPRQRSVANCRRQPIPAARDVRFHEPHPRPRADDDGLLHLPRHSGGAGARKTRPQPHGGAHVHLLLGHAVVDHAAGRHRLFRRGRDRRFAGDEDRLGIDVGRQHHLLHPILLRAESGAGAAGRQPLLRRPWPDGAGRFRHLVHLRRHPGLSGLRRRPARRRRAGMAAAGIAGHWRLRGGDARRRHHAALAIADHQPRAGHPDPDGFDRAVAGTPAGPGAGRVALAVIARQNGRR